MYTTATALLEAMIEQGIEYLFVNLGSDHPGLVEAIARAQLALSARVGLSAHRFPRLDLLES